MDGKEKDRRDATNERIKDSYLYKEVFAKEGVA